MHIIGSTILLLALGASAVAGHLIHSSYEHGHHQPAVSYAVVDLHDEHHDSPYHHISEVHEIHPYSEIHEVHGGHDDHHHNIHHDHVIVYEHHNDHDDHKEHKEHHDEGHDKHHSHAKYDFKYGVNDPKTGDVKQQWESRDGDKVKGGYTLKESDGTTRVVHYMSDKKKGFEAIVHKIGEAKVENKEHEHQEHHGHIEHHQQYHGWDH